MLRLDVRTIISGEPGEHWLNDTDRPWYQLDVAGFNTCAFCWQYNGRISRYWPLPFHGNCRCRQRRIAMGQRAPLPFTDNERAMLAMEGHEQAALMGKALFRLWQEGVVEFGDIVTPGRIRTLEEVIALKRLSIKRLVAAGVSRAVAERAYFATHAPEHEAAAAHRKRLLGQLANAHAAHEMVVRHLADKMAARVAIAPGPSYTTKAGIILPGIAAQPLTDESSTRKRHAAELAALLKSGAATRAAMGGPRRLGEGDRRIVESELGASAARSIAAFVAEVAGGLAVGKAYSDAVMALYRKYAR